MYEMKTTLRRYLSHLLNVQQVVIFGEIMKVGFRHV